MGTSSNVDIAISGKPN